MRYEEYDSLLLEQFNTISYICDVQTYELVHLNKKGMEVYDIADHEEYVGKKCYEILQGRKEPCSFCTNDCLEEGKNYYWEHYNEKVGGWYQLTDTLCRIGEKLCRMEIAQDITEYKEQVKILSDTISLENILIQCLEVLTKQRDINKAMNKFLAMVGNYYKANRAYIFEFDFKRQVINNTFEWCIPGITKEIHKLQNIPLEVIDEWLKKFKKDGEFYITSVGSELDHDSEEYRILEMQGIESLMAAPLYSDGEIVGFLGVDDPRENFGNLVLLRATTDCVLAELDKRRLMKELEVALQRANVANQSKTNFLFNMSHDIRTPMNAILGFSAMAGKYIEDKERALNSLEKLNKAGEHLLHLINAVLDMARIESGRLEFNLQSRHIPTLLEDTKNLFELEMQKKNHTFVVECDIKDEIVFLDPLRIAQVELNLISNALKYTPEGGTVTYTVKQIESEEEGYATYQATVKDTGIGMSEEFCEHVFEAFEREKTSAIEGIQGTGLGLAITKSFVEQMGGTIICKSKQGVGTEFIFTVSFKIGTESDLVTEEAPDVSEDSFENKRILLVEDNELNREIAADILMEYGFSIDTAENGLEAVDKIANSADGEYDLVLMDVQMPVMDGFEATMAIRKMENKNLANIPIIAMTANAFEEDRQAALLAGMNEHIAKPIDVPKMIKVLQKIL